MENDVVFFAMVQRYNIFFKYVSLQYDILGSHGVRSSTENIYWANFYQILTNESRIPKGAENGWYREAEIHKEPQKEPTKEQPQNDDQAEKTHQNLDAEIKALKMKFDLEHDIKVKLADLLEIIPRKRRRADAYKGLIRVLKDEYGVNLEIVRKL